MDFRLSEEQTLLRDLAREILERELDLDRLKQAEAGGDGFDRALWATLAQANLLGSAVPEAQGGTGFGLAELAVLLLELGRAVAPVPALPSLCLAGLAIAERGSEAQRERWLRPLAAGECVLSAALLDPGSDDPAVPATKARRDGDGFVLDGRKREVPALHLAERVLVPAQTDGGPGLFLVDPNGAGVTLRRGSLSGGEPIFELELSSAGIPADALLGGESGIRGDAAAWLWERALVGIALLQVGVSERALEITTAYLREREQFGVPIGSFQAVQHRAADAYIDLEAMRWTAWRAVDRLVRGEPAAREALVAKFWAAEGGARIAATGQHLHGGMGSDVDYPIHRHFVWSRRLALMLGGASDGLARLGRDMARTGPEEDA